MEKSIVVGYDSARGIGADNDLLWQRDLPADLARFKQLTMNGTIIMGRKTFDSIGRALPGRQNIVVSRQNLNIPGVQVVHDLAAAYKLAEQTVFIIGGASIYQLSLSDVDVIYATEVKATFPNATVFFPAIDVQWREVSREHHDADERNKYDYDFVVYRRD